MEKILKFFLVVCLFCGFTACAAGPGGTEVGNPPSPDTGLNILAYACHQDSDCVFTKRRNKPTHEQACICDSLCSGTLVNTQEATERTNAYNTFCQGGYQEGSLNGSTACPMASCAGCGEEAFCDNGKCASREIVCGP